MNRIKHLGISLTKKVKNLYSKNCHTLIKEIEDTEELQNGGRVRCRDDPPPHKYIRNTSTCGTTPTEHLLNAGRRPQTSQKARNSPTYLGRAKEKRKTETKE